MPQDQDAPQHGQSPDVIDLTGLTLDELRAARRRLESDEQELSFVRRVLHGRIDILSAEWNRRVGGGDDVLPQLSSILADPPSAHRYQGGRRLADVDVSVHTNAVAIAADHLDREVSSTDPRTMSDTQLAEALARLRAHEVQVSTARTQIHTKLDGMGNELTRRYREGSAQVDDLLAAARRK